MLVSGARLTRVTVALSLVALLTFVTSAARTEAGASSGSEDVALHATKSSRSNLNRSRNKEEEPLAMVKPAVSLDASSNAGFFNNSGTMTDVSHQKPVSRTSRGLNSGKGSKKNQSKNANSNDESQDTGRSAFWSEDIQVGCKELRARRYISDGFCTSEQPINEVACAGNCLPIMDMPWYAEFVKTVAKTKLKDWQCVEDVVRKKRVKLLCQNGTSRYYRIKVVESCKCKKMSNSHNRTSHQKKRRRRKKITTNSGS